MSEGEVVDVDGRVEAGDDHVDRARVVPAGEMNVAGDLHPPARPRPTGVVGTGCGAR